MTLSFTTHWRDELPGFYTALQPTPLSNARLVWHNADLAESLGVPSSLFDTTQGAGVWGGETLLPGMSPLAQVYSGHQFGVWAGQLGDGRGILLGEQLLSDGSTRDWHLKGAGLTPYSRMGDGRAVLRSTIRECLASEAMHHLGIPTTRALSIVTSDTPVMRERVEQGAMMIRVAESHARFGHFEHFYYRREPEKVQQLADFVIRHHWPHLQDEQDKYRLWFSDVVNRTARLIARWQAVGFAHGVMNTDNLSILGLTLDYGPYGWVEDYDPDWTPNTTDAQGRRYRFGTQMQVAYWNLSRLAQALSPLFADVAPLQAGLAAYQSTFVACTRRDAAAKLGLAAADDDDLQLYLRWQQLMQDGGMDMTLAWRALMRLEPAAPDAALLDAVYYDDARQQAVQAPLQQWLQDYAARLQADPLSVTERTAKMAAANPLYVLRNWLAQEAIDRAEQGDLGGVHALQDVLRDPYTERPGYEHFAGKRPAWADNRAGCSMLSCSS